MKKESVFENEQKNALQWKLFVNPLKIDRSKFTKHLKAEPKQRIAQELIKEAFREVDMHSEKYSKPFYIIIPNEKGTASKKIIQLKKYAEDLNGEITDWVEMALAWAQMIDNGEWWDVICNYMDPINCQRIILWKNGYYRFIGFMLFSKTNRSMMDIYDYDLGLESEVSYTLPVVSVSKDNFSKLEDMLK